jgi:peptide methionine sulfoxide reductase msrA/msrB
VEFETLERFYDAEKYHQAYLIKISLGNCHISNDEVDKISEMIIDPGNYQRPAENQIRANLSDLQYKVTQNPGTETACNNEYCDNHERGLYMDVVTGDP